LRIDGWLDIGHLTPFELETTTIFLRYVVMVDILRQCFVDVRGGKNEDLGDGDGIEPPFDPAPDGRKEAGRTDDLKDILDMFFHFRPMILRRTNILSSVSG
jgi:hypothetical protein